MRMKLATVALALFAFTPGARAEVTKHPPSGLQFELPAGWKTRTDAGTVVAELPGGKASVSFKVTEHANLERYREEWVKGLGPQLTDLEVDVDAEASDVNGLQQVSSAGTATLGGKPIHWDLTLVKGGQKVLAVAALGEDTGGVDKVRASVRRIVRPMLKGSAASTNDDPPIIPDYDPGN